MVIWLVMPRNVGDRHLSVANEPAALNGSVFLRGSWRVELQIQVHVLYRVTVTRYIAFPVVRSGSSSEQIPIATPEASKQCQRRYDDKHRTNQQSQPVSGPHPSIAM